MAHGVFTVTHTLSSCVTQVPEHVGSHFPCIARQSLDHWTTKSFFFLMTLKNIRGASLVAQRLKRLPPVQETQVRSLGQEDPLEKETVTHSSILAWRIPWTEESDEL